MFAPLLNSACTHLLHSLRLCRPKSKSLEKNRAAYWLRLIARQAPGAPVVVLATQCDMRPDGLKEVTADTLQTQLGQESVASFPEHITVVHGYGWSTGLPDDIRESVRRRHRQAHAAPVEARKDALPLVKGATLGYPPGFFGVKEWMEEALGDGEKASACVGKDAYVKACVEKGLLREDADAYLPVFRSLGLCFWIGDLGDSVKASANHFLFNPGWVKEPVYTLTCAPVGAHQHGVMTLNEIRALWNASRSKPGMQASLWSRLPFHEVDGDRVLALMCACGLCIELHPDEHGARYLLPDLLGLRGQARWTKLSGQGIAHGELKLDFLDVDTLLRFIAEWFRGRTGVEPSEDWHRDEIVIHEGDAPGTTPARTLALQIDPDARTVHAQVRAKSEPERIGLAARIEDCFRRTLTLLAKGDQNGLDWNWPWKKAAQTPVWAKEQPDADAHRRERVLDLIRHDFVDLVGREPERTDGWPVDANRQPDAAGKQLEYAKPAGTTQNEWIKEGANRRVRFVEGSKVEAGRPFRDCEGARRLAILLKSPNKWFSGSELTNGADGALAKAVTWESIVDGERQPTSKPDRAAWKTIYQLWKNNAKAPLAGAAWANLRGHLAGSLEYHKGYLSYRPPEGTASWSV